jgi:Tfp pilus assembly PilM family ATPase
MLRKFTSFFIEEAVAGLDIGRDYIAAARLFYRKDKTIAMKNIACVKTAPDATSDETALLIKQLWRRYRIGTSTVCLSLNSPSLLLKYFKYPNLSTDELESVLKLEAEQTFQRHEQELAMDWYVYPATSSLKDEHENKTKEGVLIATTREDIDKHLAILKTAGLYPVALNIGCFAIANLFLKIKNFSKAKVVCIANITNHSTDISIITQGHYIYPRSIYTQNNSFDDTINYIIENIKDMLRYHQFKLQRPPVEAVVFTGEILSSEKLKENIKNKIDLPVEFWDPLNDIFADKRLLKNDAINYHTLVAPSLGLALHNMSEE